MEDNINYAEKIENFKLLVENNSEDIAVKYLEKVNWDEQKAALLFNQENRTMPQKVSSNNNQRTKSNNGIDLSKFEECPIIFPSKGFFSNFLNIFTYSYSNLEYVDEFRNLSGYTSSYESFINNLRNKLGLIFFYDFNNVQLMKIIINDIKKDPLTKELLSNKIIFPMYNECDIAIEMLKFIKIRTFPTMIVCKFKNKNAFAILKKTNKFDIPNIRDTILSVAELLNTQIKTNNNDTKDMNQNYNINSMSYGDVIAQQKRDMEELERKEREKKEKERKLIEEKKKEEKKIEEEKKRIEEEIKNQQKRIEILKKNLPPEPDDSNPDKCTILFRYPNGSTNVERKFLKTDKIQLLYDYVNTLGRDIYTENTYLNFELIQTFPFKRYDNKEKTLEEEGLFPNAMLQIKEID